MFMLYFCKMNNNNFGQCVSYFTETKKRDSIGFRKTLDLMNDFFRQMNKILQSYLNHTQVTTEFRTHNIIHIIGKQIIQNIETLIITRILIKSFILKFMSVMKNQANKSPVYKAQQLTEHWNIFIQFFHSVQPQMKVIT